MEKQITPDDILSKINEITQKQQASKDVRFFLFLQYFSFNYSF
jgi:hypothetical protein